MKTVSRFRASDRGRCEAAEKGGGCGRTYTKERAVAPCYNCKHVCYGTPLYLSQATAALYVACVYVCSCAFLCAFYGL